MSMLKKEWNGMETVIINTASHSEWGKMGTKLVSFSCCRGFMLSVTLSVPQGEGECMVMDLWDITLHLADGIFKSNI